MLAAVNSVIVTRSIKQLSKPGEKSDPALLPLFNAVVNIDLAYF
jgi:hypothetical protein